MKYILSIFLISLSFLVSADNLNERKKFIKKMETKISMEAKERKIRSEAILKRMEIPINSNLPYIEDEKEALQRKKEEIVNRVLALLVVSVKAEGLEQRIVESIIETYKLKAHFSPKETEFISDKSPSEHDKTQFIWRYESAWVLLWSLGYIPELSPPNKICDVPLAVTLMRERTKEEFIADAKLRSISDILNESDLIYRYHWAVVDARIKKNELTSLNSSVVMERHYALNWLIGYMAQEWDDISTDT